MGMIMIDSDNFQKEVPEDREFNSPVFGARLCGLRKPLKPEVMECGSGHPEIKICFQDAGQTAGAAERLNVTGIPW
jgi:thioredoxin 1